jgi:hypothetical protein
MAMMSAPAVMALEGLNMDSLLARMLGEWPFADGIDEG